MWSEPPDDALFAAADAGLLGTNRGLEQQVVRILRSAKRDALVEGFAAELRNGAPSIPTGGYETVKVVV
ncbi:MAG: DUF1592 domain-containing protein [Myxococcales bacterium]|nr:MAG: DUF1592 domain-containing protein [Myxococcales bacterium]